MSNEKQGCLGWLLRLFGIGAEKAFPYRQRDDFLSPAELAFFHVLHSAVGREYVICPKVRLADIVYVAQRRQRQAAFNRISSKHVDFLLCDPETLAPRIAIELDDTSHRQKSRVKRDRFVNGVFAAAELPLLRVPVRRSYDPRDLSTQVVAALRGESVAHPNGLSDPPPTCPRCGAPMTLRTARRGVYQGNQFYGCTTYPRCHGIVALKE